MGGADEGIVVRLDVPRPQRVEEAQRAALGLPEVCWVQKWDKINGWGVG